MRIERALRLRDECHSNLRGLFSHSRAFCAPHSAMLNKRTEIYAKTSKAPRWVRAYLDGVWSCYSDELYRDALVFGAWIDGKFYSTHRNRDDYYEKNGIDACAFSEKTRGSVTGHYWINDPSKPYFTSATDPR